MNIASGPSSLVSFVIVGRNDGYMGDYLYRLGTSLSFLAESARRAGLLEAIEVVMVDWASAEPLSAQLPLTATARQVTRFIEVTPAMVEARCGEVRWFPTCAVNVGVRRARGEFVFFTDSDCLWTEEALASLGRLLRGETTLPVPVQEAYCYVRRYQIPWATAHRKPRLGEWRRLTALIGSSTLPELPAASFLGGFSAGQLMHRELWARTRGYDEALERSWGWADNDLALRVTQRHAWLDVSAYGFAGLHMEHWPQDTERAQRDPATINPMIIRNTPRPNGTDWGLGDITIPEARACSRDELEDGPGCIVPLTAQTASPTWRPGPEVASFLTRIGARAQAHVPQPQLEAVAQIALADRPRSVCWCGDIEPAILQAIVAATPGTELFFINPWTEGASDHQPCNPAALSGHVQSWGFQGWARVVQGDPATALERLEASRIGDLSFELAWVDAFAPDSVIRGIADRLAPGGVMLLPAFRNGRHDLARVRALAPACSARALGTTGLIAVTAITPMPSHIDVPVSTVADNESASSLRVVLNMLLRDKALGLIDPETLQWDGPLLVIRSAHMGRMEAFFDQLLTRCAAPQLHILSHARDEATLRATASCPFTFHAYETPGPYRLEDMPGELLDRLRAIPFAALFFLDVGTRGDRLDEVERLLTAIQPEPVVCFMGNGKFAQAPDSRQRRLAEGAFLRLIEWYQFRLEPTAARDAGV